jgi:hypothetical protein
LESEEVLEEPLDALDPSCYNKSDDVIDNIDEFIHVGRCKWDVICYGLMEIPFMILKVIFNCFPLEQPYVIATDSDVWKHEDDMITDLFQPPKDDLLQHSHDDFNGHILGGLIHILLSTWIYSTKKIFNHCCALILMRVRT